MTVRAEIVTVRCKRLPQSTQCVTSGRYVRLIVCWYTFFFLMTFPCSLALSATLLSILSPHVGREYCPHGLKSPIFLNKEQVIQLSPGNDVILEEEALANLLL